MTARRRMEPEQRRAELLGAAMDCFRERGVQNTAVSDIVRRAGVAQGTFYLYFDSKEDVTCAVVELMLEQLAERIERAIDLPDATAVEKLLVMRDAMLEISDEPHEIEMMELFHRPENKAVHDRVTAGFAPRVAPVIEHIIAQGVDEGVFDVANPTLAAWYVLGGFAAYEYDTADAAQAVPRMRELSNYVLRGLGYEGPA